MSKFHIMSLGGFIHQEGIDITLESFAELFHNVTSKHRKKMVLSMVTKGVLTEHIHKKVSQLNIKNAVKLVSWSEQETIEEMYEEASIMILPSRENIIKLIGEAFSFGLPVVCYEKEKLREVVDHSCGMMIEYGNYEENIYQFSEIMKMLYFDPEARKILKRGAMKKYETQFSWA